MPETANVRRSIRTFPTCLGDTDLALTISCCPYRDAKGHYIWAELIINIMLRHVLSIEVSDTVSGMRDLGICEHSDPYSTHLSLHGVRPPIAESILSVQQAQYLRSSSLFRLWKPTEWEMHSEDPQDLPKTPQIGSLKACLSHLKYLDQT